MYDKYSLYQSRVAVELMGSDVDLLGLTLSVPRLSAPSVQH